MTPERLQQVEQLYHAALEREPERREALIEEACAGDDALRKEVETLLAFQRQAEDFMEAPAMQVAAQALAGEQIQPMAGRMLGCYEILSPLGAGAMGEVYRARDTSLGREVAVKVLPPAFSRDPDRLRRFEQEARAAGMLNHPNILTIYAVGSHEGCPFLVSELLEGETLRDRLRAGGFAPPKAIDYALQMAKGLAAAHEKGIVHRDLKPENLFLTKDGRLKILDFGLAKLTQPKAGSEWQTLTEAGAILGTAGYMSPEQVRGQPADHRADIFVFGVILYEMLSGKRAFQRDSRVESLNAILKEPPGFPDSTLGVAAGLKGVLRRCLEKNPEERFQSAHDLVFALEGLADRSTPAVRRAWPVFALLGIAVATGAGFWVIRPAASVPAPASQPEPSKAPVSPPRPDSAPPAKPISAPPSVPQPAANDRSASLKAMPLTSYPGYELYPTFSPDATQVAFSWNGENQNNFDIYVKVVGAGAPLRVTTSPRPDLAPAWSPDGKALAFLRVQGNMAELLLVPPLGGAPERKLAEISGFQGGGPGQTGHFLAWSPDSKWLVVAHANSGNMNSTPPPILVSAETGETRALMEPVPGFARQDAHPSFSPNGRTLAFSRRSSVLSSEIYVLDLSHDLRPLGSARQLTSENQLSIAPVWSGDGREVIFISGTNPSTMGLWKIAASGGKAEPLEFGYTPVNTVARAGKRLAFSHQLVDSDIWRVDLAAAGSEPAPPARMISSSRLDNDPQFSPDGSKIAFRSTRSGNWEIHLANGDGSDASQLTSFGGPPLGPARWSPDGKRLVFVASPRGSVQIYTIEVAGGVPKPMHRDLTAQPYVNWSRDGKWIYFVSRRTGQDQSWKTPVGGGQPVQITRNGGYSALESADGKFVYYLKAVEVGPHHLWRVPVGGGEESLVTDRLGGQFNFADGGVYSINPRGPSRPTLLQFFSFATTTFEELADVASVPRNGFSVSPDRRVLIYSQPEMRGTDLMLVDNFR